MTPHVSATGILRLGLVADLDIKIVRASKGHQGMTAIMNDCPIDNNEHLEDFGVIISSYLKWTENVFS